MEISGTALNLLRETEGQYGVELRGAAAWAKARQLVAAGLGDIDGDPGQELPAMFWASGDGRSLLEDMVELERGFESDCYLCDGEPHWEHAPRGLA